MAHVYFAVVVVYPVGKKSIKMSASVGSSQMFHNIRAWFLADGLGYRGSSEPFEPS